MRATISSCTLVIEKPVIKQKKLVVTGVNAGNMQYSVLMRSRANLVQGKYISIKSFLKNNL